MLVLDAVRLINGESLLSLFQLLPRSKCDGYEEETEDYEI